jgi:hypothetical protein
MIKTNLLFIVLLLVGQHAFAQTFLEEANGRPILKTALEDVSGDPYLYKTWKVGKVQLLNGKTYDNVPLNVNLISKEVFFKGANDEQLAFVQPVSSFAFTDTVKGVPVTRLFKKIDPKLDNDYFIVIADGKISLLKKIWKVIWEEKTYNSGTVVKNILDKSAYYTLADGKLLQIKPSKKEILNAFPDHKEEVDKYVKAEKISFNSNQDLSKLFIYYNSL